MFNIVIFCVAITAQTPDDSLRIDIVANPGVGIKDPPTIRKSIVKVGINCVVAVEFNISRFLSVPEELYVVSGEKRICVGEEGTFISKIFS